MTSIEHEKLRAAVEVVKAACRDGSTEGGTINSKDIVGAIKELNESVLILTSKVNDSDKRRSLEWALSTGSPSFEYRIGDSSDDLDGKELISDILLCFRKGWSFWIHKPYLVEDCCVESDKIESLPKHKRLEMEGKFFTKIIDIIHNLVGSMPRVTKDENSKYTLYYS